MSELAGESMAGFNWQSNSEKKLHKTSKARDTEGVV